MKKIELQTVVYKEGAHYVAQCLNVDVSSFGHDEQDAVSNLKEAVELYFEDSHEVVPVKISKPEISSFTYSYA
jgi:predicted RNase H-like HicB family nuclease